VSVLLALVACRSAYCDRVEGYAEDCGHPYTHDERKACEDEHRHCDRADEELLAASLDCFEDAGFYACDHDGTDTGVLVALSTCLAPLEDVSAECDPQVTQP
jgi:hypothetical protein